MLVRDIVFLVTMTFANVGTDVRVYAHNFNNIDTEPNRTASGPEDKFGLEGFTV